MVTVFPGQKILASHVNEKVVKTGDTVTGTIIFPNQEWTPTDTTPTAIKGAIYYDASESTPKHYNGSVWVALGPGAGQGGFNQAFVSQTVVNVNHNLGNANPVIQAYDVSNNLIDPVTAVAVDTNNVTVTFGTAISGTIVVLGGAQIVNVLGVKRHTESFTSQTTVTVAHNLNANNPSVTVWDSGTGEIIYPDVTTLGANTVRLDFAASTSGVVEVQGGTQSATPGSGTADFLPNANNTWDIGSGTFKWKDSYFAGDVHVDNSIMLGLLASDPSSPTEGQMWYNTTDKQFKGYNGTSVVILG